MFIFTLNDGAYNTDMIKNFYTQQGVNGDTAIFAKTKDDKEIPIVRYPDPDLAEDALADLIDKINSRNVYITNALIPVDC